MIVMINGCFGIGKTTAARLVRKALPGTLIYNPEWAGSALMRLPKFIRLKGSGTQDFQDISLWRKATIAGIRAFKTVASGPVLVPMTFTNRDYFDEITTALKTRGHQLLNLCLTADLPTIQQRLTTRSVKNNEPESTWTTARIETCIKTHRDTYFGEHINTDDLTPNEVAAEIIKRIRIANT